MTEAHSGDAHFSAVGTHCCTECAVGIVHSMHALPCPSAVIVISSPHAEWYETASTAPQQESSGGGNGGDGDEGGGGEGVGDGGGGGIGVGGDGGG